MSRDGQDPGARRHGPRRRRHGSGPAIALLLATFGLSMPPVGSDGNGPDWLLDIAEPAPRADDSGPEAPPPWLDLRRLRARVEALAWGGQAPRDVLIIEVETADGADFYPDGLSLTVHLALAPVAGGENAAPDISLTARAEARSPRLGRRTGQLTAGSSAGVAIRFSGLPELGALSSAVPGRSVTFRAPLHQLRLQSTPERWQGARTEDGAWDLTVWAGASSGDLQDHLPDGWRDGNPAVARLRLPGSGRDRPDR